MGVGYGDIPNASGSYTLRWWVLIFTTTTPNGIPGVTTLDVSENNYKSAYSHPIHLIVDHSANGAPISNVISKFPTFAIDTTGNTLEDADVDDFE